LHILVAEDGQETTISVGNAGSAHSVRLPAGASGPISRLQSRIALALEGLLQQIARKNCLVGAE